VTHQFGWIKNPPGFRAYAATLPTGDDLWEKLRAADDGGDRFWYRALRLSLGNNGRWLKQRGSFLVIRSYQQGDIGSCVGNGNAKVLSYIAALNVWHRQLAEEFRGMFSPEWLYYAARKQGGMLHERMDGATGYGAAKAAIADGALVQGRYGNVDLSEYSVATCRAFGNGRGIPPEAITEAAKHKCGQYLKADTAEKVWLAAGAGLPLNLCSSMGFESMRRDEDGAIEPRGRWSHCMCGGAARYTTKKGRKLVLCDNSWGDDWAKGPYFGDQPEGSFYVDLDVMGEMAEEGDTFVDVQYAGDVIPAPHHSFVEM